MNIRMRLIVAIAAGGLACGGWEARAQKPITKEYKIKATYLFNFVQYVEWPASAFVETNSPIMIGVLGDDDFGSFLDQLLEGETVKSRPLRVKRSRQVEDLKGCHLLFVSKSESVRLAQTMAALGESGVLTVGETDGFARRGGVINFTSGGDRLRFEINLEAARRRGLKLNSQLLSLAKIIGPVAGKESE